MNILFVGGQGNRPDANSVCINNMAFEMLKRGHKVWIIAMGEANASITESTEILKIEYIPENYYRRISARVINSDSFLFWVWFKIISMLRHMLLLFFYPNTSPLRARIVASRAEQIVRKEHINVAVCIFTPYDNIYAGLYLKNKFGNEIKVISYHLDLRTASINPSKYIRDYIHKHALKSLVKESYVVDKILIPFSGQNETEGVEGVKLERIRFTGFPVYLDALNKRKCKVPFETDTINVCYIGSLSSENRDPRPILRLLETVSNTMIKPIAVHFWGDVAGFEKLISESSIATYHGMIASDYTWYINSQADFLLNIGNAIAYDMLPSKVFSMFATGKPIINVINHPADVTIPYFKRYNHSIDIRLFERMDNNMRILSEGIISLRNSPLKDANELFDDFKPATICDLVMA